MSTFKKAKVILLPTNKKTKYLMVYSDVEKTKGKLILNGLKNDEYKEYQNFYIILDDEIKEGDWFLYYNKYNQIEGVAKFIKEEGENNTLVEKYSKTTGFSKFYIGILGCKKHKIIATTDSSLRYLIKRTERGSIEQRLPQPSKQFIEKYIEEYNKGQQITECLVEYELISNEEYFGNTVNPDDDVPYFDERLTINPKDNTLTIKKVKDSYTREEVIEFGNKVKEYCKDGWKSDSLHRVFFEWDKWVEETL